MTFNNDKYKEIYENIQKFSSNNYKIVPKIIAVSKNQPISSVIDATEFGVRFFAENKVQEAKLKFGDLKKKFNDLELHMTGSIQTNKVKKSLEIFDYFHTLDREKLANEFHKYISHSDKFNKKKFFIQVNTGEEPQKSGISLVNLREFIRYCLNDLSLKIIGLMCMPPIDEDPKKHFNLISQLAIQNKLKYLSMGMSADYKIALECGATHIRLGTILFGER
jgi:hypothetical protein